MLRAAGLGKLRAPAERLRRPSRMHILSMSSVWEERMDAMYTFRVRQWVGSVDECPGVNSHGATRAELIENLASALT